METKPSYQLQNTFTNKNKYKKIIFWRKKSISNYLFSAFIKKMACQKKIRALTEWL